MNAYITGIGIYSSLGSNVEEVVAALRDERSAIVSDDNLILAGFNSPYCAPVEEPCIDSLPNSRRHRALLTQAGRYAYVAAREALTMAGQEDMLSGHSSRNVGVIVSNDIVAQPIVTVHKVMSEQCDTDYLSAHDAFLSLDSNVSVALSQIFGIRGLSLTVGAACSGGLHAVALADSLVRQGLLDGCLVVGSQETGAISWCAFDTLATGAVPSGGAAAIYIESELRYRGHSNGCLARILGYGCTTGPSPITPDFFSEQRAMRLALDVARCKPEDIALVNGHLTGTRVGDEIEHKALEAVFGSNVPKTLATKKWHGHELAMSGVSQIVETIALNRGCSGLHVLANAFGFGGNNASVVFKILS